MEIKLKETIHAPIDKVWQTLTDSDCVSQYMFNSKVDSFWKENERIIYYIENDGTRMDVVDGIIKKLEKPTSFSHSLYPVGADYPNIEENHIYVHYSLKEVEGGTELSIKQDGFDTAAKGTERFESAKNGWDAILAKLKEVAESL